MREVVCGRECVCGWECVCLCVLEAMRCGESSKRVHIPPFNDRGDGMAVIVLQPSLYDILPLVESGYEGIENCTQYTRNTLLHYVLSRSFNLLDSSPPLQPSSNSSSSPFFPPLSAFLSPYSPCPPLISLLISLVPSPTLSPSPPSLPISPSHRPPYSSCSPYQLPCIPFLFDQLTDNSPNNVLRASLTKDPISFQCFVGIHCLAQLYQHSGDHIPVRAVA